MKILISHTRSVPGSILLPGRIQWGLCWIIVSFCVINAFHLSLCWFTCLFSTCLCKSDGELSHPSIHQCIHCFELNATERWVSEAEATQVNCNACQCYETYRTSVQLAVTWWWNLQRSNASSPLCQWVSMTLRQCGLSYKSTFKSL